MIQDIAPHHFNNSYQSVLPTDNTFAFVYCNGHFLLKGSDDKPELLSYKELPANIRASEYRYLFSFDNRPFFLFLLDERGFSYLPYRQLPVASAINSHSVWLPLIITTAAQLADWYGTHRYCGHRGHPTNHSSTERAMCCANCGNIGYPRINPVVIVAITHNGRLLLTHYADRNIKPYVLISGFVEIGESLEAAAQRESLEEVGLHISNLKYFGIQPWGLSSSLSAGFFADITESDPNLVLDT